MVTECFYKVQTWNLSITTRLLIFVPVNPVVSYALLWISP